MTQRHWTLMVVCAATAMLMLDIAVVNTALSRIAEDLDAGLGGLQWVVDAYTLALAATVLTFGSLADRFGRRRLFTAGLALFTLASAACAAATGIDVLVAARAVQGVGAAIMFAVSLAILADAFPGAKERAGRWPPTARRSAPRSPSARSSVARSPAAWTGSGSSSSTSRSASPASGSPACTCASRVIRAPAASTSRVRSPLGSGLFLLVLALLRGNEEGWGSTPIVAALAAAVVLLAAFVVIEHRVKEPMLPLGLFRNPNFAGAQVAASAISATFFAIFLYVTLYLQQVLGLTAIEAGLVYLPAHDRDVRRLRRHERRGREGLRPGHGRRRARAGRDRRGPHDARRDRQLLAGPHAWVPDRRRSAPGCSTPP